MLLEQSRPGAGARVSIVTRNETFGRLLLTILEDWQFVTREAGGEADFVLVERGLEAPADARHVVWLSPMPLGTEPHIEVPISLVELYHYLEQLFFPVPRRHIRIPVNRPVDLNVRGVWLVGELLSVSDRGARLSCAALLPKGESLLLDFTLDGYPLRVTAEVIYDIPPGDASGREHPQAGLLFRPLKPALRLALRRFIERKFVERACAHLGLSGSDASLSWFDLVKNPWAELAD